MKGLIQVLGNYIILYIIYHIVNLGCFFVGHMSNITVLEVCESNLRGDAGLWSVQCGSGKDTQVSGLKCFKYVAIFLNLNSYRITFWMRPVGFTEAFDDLLYLFYAISPRTTSHKHTVK